MRVLKIRLILFPHLPPQPLLLLLTNSTFDGFLVPPPVLPDVVASPAADEDEFGAEADGCADLAMEATLVRGKKAREVEGCD